jgi:hypothetical protein
MSESWSQFPTPALSYSQLLNTCCRCEFIGSLAGFHFQLNPSVSLCDNTTCKAYKCIASAPQTVTSVCKKLTREPSMVQCDAIYHFPLCPICKLCDSTCKTGLLFLTATLDAAANQICHYEGNTLYL